MITVLNLDMALEAIRMSALQNDENGDFIDVCSNEDENSMMSLATTASNHSTETAPFSQAGSNSICRTALTTLV